MKPENDEINWIHVHSANQEKGYETPAKALEADIRQKLYNVTKGGVTLPEEARKALEIKYNQELVAIL